MGRRVAAFGIVFADCLHELALEARQSVDEGRFAHPRGAQQSDGLARLQPGLQGFEPRAFTGREHDDIRADGDGFDWEGGLIALGLGNGRQAGGGRELCPEALVNDGLLELTVIPELSGELAATLGTLVRNGQRAALERSAVRARLPWVELEGLAGPFTLNLDGEPLQAGRFRVDCVPGRLRMHLPPQSPLLAQPS